MTTVLKAFNVKEQKNKDIGIEIEMEGRHLKFPIEKYWTVANDGSLRGPSIEYILRNPVSSDKVMHRLKYLQRELQQAGSVLQPSERCGVHIHVNCQSLTTQQVINFAVLYLILEDVLVHWCGQQREGNMYCLRASDADRIIYGLSRCRSEDSMDYMQNAEFRYAAINMAALRKFGSVEFRALETPKDFKKIHKWAEILLRIKKVSLSYKEPYHIIENMSQMGEREFIKHILKDLAPEVMCPNLITMIQEGVQRVQEIAYTVVEKPKKKSNGKPPLYGNPGLLRQPTPLEPRRDQVQYRIFDDPGAIRVEGERG